MDLNNLNLTTLLGGGAIFATIALVWDKIRWIWSRITSIAFVTASLNDIEIFNLKN
jgi:hypothetical protein